MRTGTKTRAGTPETYLERVNLAIDHVMANLVSPLRLGAVAKAAHLSPYHFHRVFQVMMGETLGEFVKRQRLDRALFLMAHSARESLTDIAHACGFASSSDFSRSFKRRFGAAPSKFDIVAWRERHARELDAVVDGFTGGRRLLRLPRSPLAANPDGFRVRVRDLPARTVAYVRAGDPYSGGVGESVVKAISTLGDWAEKNGLGDAQWLGFQYEHPEITPLEQCVYHAAIVVPEDRLGRVRGRKDEQSAPSISGWRGEIGRCTFPPMIVAEVEMAGGIDLELRLMQWLYGAWLPRSGYVPDDQPAFEAFIGRPLAHGMEYFELRAQLPIRPARAGRRRI